MELAAAGSLVSAKAGSRMMTYAQTESPSRRPIRIVRPTIDFDIMILLADGKTRKQIAYQLGVSHQWVSLHIGRLKDERAALTDAQLIAHAFRNGVLR